MGVLGRIWYDVEMTRGRWICLGYAGIDLKQWLKHVAKRGLNKDEFRSLELQQDDRALGGLADSFLILNLYMDSLCVLPAYEPAHASKNGLGNKSRETLIKRRHSSTSWQVCALLNKAQRFRVLCCMNRSLTLGLQRQRICGKKLQTLFPNA